jgi:hypothetical protein
MLLLTIILYTIHCVIMYCSDDEGGVISPDLLGTGGKISMVEMASFAMNPASQTEVLSHTCTH